MESVRLAVLEMLETTLRRCWVESVMRPKCGGQIQISRPQIDFSQRRIYRAAIESIRRGSRGRKAALAQGPSFAAVHHPPTDSTRSEPSNNAPLLRSFASATVLPPLSAQIWKFQIQSNVQSTRISATNYIPAFIHNPSTPPDRHPHPPTHRDRPPMYTVMKDVVRR